MKTKLSWLCAVAMGMSALPATMANAAPERSGNACANVPVVAKPIRLSRRTGHAAEPANGGEHPAGRRPGHRQVLPGVRGERARRADNAPSRDVKLTLPNCAASGQHGAARHQPDGGIEFGMRSDEVVSKAMLNLEYTPSPSLLPVQSQLKVYLNDELMDVLPVTKEQLGKKRWRRCRSTRCLSPTLTACVWSLSATTAMSAKTRPAARCGWTSGVTLAADDLPVAGAEKRSLAFPVPFFDPRDNRPLTLPMVFAASPDVTSSWRRRLSLPGLVHVPAGAARASR
jgi:hypothetical protein